MTWSIKTKPSVHGKCPFAFRSFTVLPRRRSSRWLDSSHLRRSFHLRPRQTLTVSRSKAVSHQCWKTSFSCRDSSENHASAWILQAQWIGNPERFAVNSWDQRLAPYDNLLLATIARSIKILKIILSPSCAVDSREVVCFVFVGRDYHWIARHCKTVNEKARKEEGINILTKQDNWKDKILNSIYGRKGKRTLWWQKRKE